MTLANRATVEMQFDANFQIDSWHSFSLRDSFTDPLGELSFTIQPLLPDLRRYRDRARKGELVAVFINGAAQGVYIITTTSTSVSNGGGVTMKITAKSPLATPYEGSVDPRLSVSTTTDTPVSQVVLAAMLPYGFNVIGIASALNVSARMGKPIANKGTPLTKSVAALKHQECQAQEGETAYAFCDRIFTRLGLCLHVDNAGALLLRAPNYTQEKAYTVKQSFSGSGPTGEDVDVFTGSVEEHDTNDGQFSEVQVRGLRRDDVGQTKTAEPNATVTASSFMPTRSVYRSQGAAYKPKIIKDKMARDSARSESVAKLVLSLPAKDAYFITGTVDGIVSKSGRVWQPDTIAHVYVEALGVDEEMWIVERTLRQDRNSGQTTELKLLPKNALVLGQVPQ